MGHLADDGDADETLDESPHDRRGNEGCHPAMRSAPKSRKKAPIRTARVEVSPLKLAVPRAAMAPTVRAEIRPVAVSGPTTSTREVPKIA
jgi:hypothetical protein